MSKRWPHIWNNFTIWIALALWHQFARICTLHTECYKMFYIHFIVCFFLFENPLLCFISACVSSSMASVNPFSVSYQLESNLYFAHIRHYVEEVFCSNRILECQQVFIVLEIVYYNLLWLCCFSSSVCFFSFRYYFILWPEIFSCCVVLCSKLIVVSIF
jgi:hypothetical protein